MTVVMNRYVHAATGDEGLLGSGLRHDLGFLVGHFRLPFRGLRPFGFGLLPHPAPAGREKVAIPLLLGLRG